MQLSSFSNKKLIENETVIFIDEIQEAKDAITKIKFLVSNKKYKFIFSGSLLGIKMKEINSMPVSFLEIIEMYPLSFREYVKALGINEQIINHLKDCFLNKKTVDDIIHKQMINLFRSYLVIGGLPEAVNAFIKTNDLNIVNGIFEKIQTGYKYDIARYSTNQKLLIKDIYDLIPSELNNQNKRFILKSLNQKSRFFQSETSFTWLKHSNTALFVHNVSSPTYPLLLNKERTLFKLFLNDTGLLSYNLFKNNQIILLNKEVKLNGSLKMMGDYYKCFL